jgi:uncharacterized protein (UPF0147 family)
LSVNGTLAFASRAWLPLLCAVILTAPLLAAAGDVESAPVRDHPRVRLETRPIPGGAELWTVFVALPPEQSDQYREMPVLSVIRDTLGENDPECSRLRDVWLLTAGKPSPLRRVASAIPFLYLLHTPKPSTSPVPVRLLDFGSPARQTQVALLSTVVQGGMLDPAGRTLRTTSRSYRMNDAEDRGARAAEAVAALAEVEADPQTPAGAAADLERLHARLLLSQSLLGGLVRNQRLSSFHGRSETDTAIARGHNWELLRQLAEANRLYFEPISFDGGEPDYAMLWVRRQDLQGGGPERFDGKLLHIADPFRTSRLAQWHGYSETWSFDAAGRRLDGPGTDEVVPLALYSLTHPRLPLLLVDFQNGGAPRRRESVGQAADEVTAGILGLSPITHWNYFLGRSVLEFVRRRHGTTSDRSQRVRAWAELSYALSTNSSVRPGLRNALARQIHAPVFDLQQPHVSREAALAWERYRRLTSEDSPLAAIVAKRRQSEQAALERGIATRFAYRLLHATPSGFGSIPELAWARRMDWNRDFLDEVARSSPQIEVTMDPARVRDSLDEVNRLLETREITRDDLSVVLARVTMNTSDDDIRHLCLRALSTMDTDASRKQLATLSRDAVHFDCAVCRQYLARKSAAPSFAGAP